MVQQPLGRRAATLAALALIALAGCDGGDEAAEWGGPERRSNGSVPVAGFEGGEDSAVATAVDFLALRGDEAARTLVDVQAGPEGGGPVTVTATLVGLPDDSIEALRYIVRLSRGEEGWRVVSARWAQRCRPGRGHRRFSPRLCV